MNSGAQRARTAHVIGGGIGGLAAAACLARRGWSVTVHERSDELREVGAGIFLKENSIRILQELECFDAVIAGGCRLTRSEIRNRHGRAILKRDVGAERVFTVLREDLHRELANAARRWGVDIRTGSEVLDLDESGTVRTRDSTFESNLIVGADGLGSLTRKLAGLEVSSSRMPNGSTRILVPRVKEDPVEGSIELWRGQKRVMIVPVGESIIYICATCREDNDRATHLPIDVDYWSREFPEFASLFERAASANPVHHTHGSVRVKGWHKGRIAILGDAVHGQPPNLGQGAGLAISNAGALAACLDLNSDIPDALMQWERRYRRTTEQVQQWSENWDYFVHQWPLGFEFVRSSIIWGLANFPPTRRHWGRLYRGDA
jgi:2-polyprenyl-6-methoxyphenol hydroxylase-like FAD-dependent oxidoreductase